MDVIVGLILFLFKVSVAVTVFSYGLHATAEAVLYLVRRPRVQIVSLLAMFLVTPTIALMLVTAFDVPLIPEVAVVAIALSPVGTLLAKKERESGGEMSYGVGLTVTAAALSIFITPLLVAFIGSLVNRPFGISPLQVGGIVFAEVFVPLLAGIAFRTLLPRVAERIREPMVKVANGILAFASLAFLVVTLPIVWGFIGLGTVAMYALFTVAALGVGHVMGGPERKNSIVLAYSCASRHPGVAISIATATYPGNNFAGAVILLMVVQGIVCPLYVKWQRRHDISAQTPPRPHARPA
jgi:bile acid:Na+ symporter, BASS family